VDGESSAGGTDMSAGSQDPEALREEIEATRQELGDTVEALAHKTDVKAQVSEQIEQTKAQVSDRVEHTREAVGQKTSEFVDKARQVSPDSALDAASGAAQKGRENPVPVAAIGAFALGVLIGRISAR
jgi:methyl-accepting chemotaxis protein